MIELLKDWPKGEPVPALSLQQPWASAVAFYGKDIENRSRNFKYRGPLIIHASSTKPYIGNFDLFIKCAREDGIEEDDLNEIKKLLEEGYIPGDFPLGCLLAVANLADCFRPGQTMPPDHPAAESPWVEEGYNWLYFDDAVPIVPFEYKGVVGISRSLTRSQSNSKDAPAGQ